MMGRSRGIRGATAAVLFLSALTVFAATNAAAVRLLANSSTAAYIQKVATGGTGDKFENMTRAYERLRFDVNDFSGAKLSLHGFLTARNELTSQNLGETRTRLYNGYLQYRSMAAGADVIRYDARFGRQWVASGVGSGTADGISLRLDRGGWGGLTAFGGTLGCDRRDRGGFDKPSQSLRYGGELDIHPRLRPAVDPQLVLSYAATRRNDMDDNSRLGARASLRVRERLRIWSELRHDFLLERDYGTAAGVEYMKPAKGLRAWAEYNRRSPALGATSVFAFFDTKDVSEFRAGIGSRVAGPYSVGFDFARTDFKGGINNVVLGDSVVTRAKVDRSKAFRFTVQRGPFSVGARFESGFAGDRTDLVFSGMHDFGDKLNVRVDLGYQDYKYGETDYENNTAASGLFAVAYRVAPDTKVTAQIEGLNNRDLKQDVRLLARVDQRLRLER
jgi:hypothetical protein